MRHLIFISLIMLTTLNGWTQQQGFIPINEGSLYYERKGSGPPLVFLHGVFLDHRMWQEQIDYFSKSYTCINLDLRGFGKSSLPTTTPYSFHEDIKILLDSLHIKAPVIIVALSMGGKAAVNFTLTYPEKTKALVLADAAIDGYLFRDFHLDSLVNAAQHNGIEKAKQLFLEYPIFSTAKTNDTVFHRLHEMIMSYSGWQWTHKNSIHGLNPPAIEQLALIKIPTLILTGEKDIWDFQQIADILHRGIAQSLKEEIADAGHMCNMEKPDEFNHLVSQFLIQTK
jgi:3-oxoadipate enol-lactonase